MLFFSTHFRRKPVNPINVQRQHFNPMLLEDFRKRAAEQTHQLLIDFDREMSLHDLDSTTDGNTLPTQRRLCSIGIYYYEEDVRDDPSQET